MLRASALKRPSSGSADTFREQGQQIRVQYEQQSGGTSIVRYMEDFVRIKTQ
jgi:hypothetical protein